MFNDKLEPNTNKDFGIWEFQMDENKLSYNELKLLFNTLDEGYFWNFFQKETDREE
jgi:hypothetical protein